MYWTVPGPRAFSSAVVWQIAIEAKWYGVVREWLDAHLLEL